LSSCQSYLEILVSDLALSLLLYPGLALVLILALVFGWLTEGRVRFGWLRGAAWVSVDGLLSLASIALAALALALLPWPLHPAAGWSWLGSPVALWAALEGAFLLPLLAGLLAPEPLGERAASREAQISAAGRCVVWLAIGVALWAYSIGSGQAGAGWAPRALPGRALAALAGLMALPAAIGAGPFGAERMLIIASLPLTLLQPWVALLLSAGLFTLVALLLKRVTSALPRLTLPAALRWCWWRALPLVLAGLLYLIFV
jgi:hypothetical protein